MREQFSPDQYADAEKLAKKLASIPEEKRVLVTMMTMAFINGMEAQESLTAGGR